MSLTVASGLDGDAEDGGLSANQVINSIPLDGTTTQAIGDGDRLTLNSKGQEVRGLVANGDQAAGASSIAVNAFDLRVKVPGTAIVVDLDEQTLPEGTIQAPDVDNPLTDSTDISIRPNGVANTALKVKNQVAAVNGIKIEGSASAAPTRVVAEGTDSDIGMNLVAKGSGTIHVSAAATVVDNALDIYGTTTFHAAINANTHAITGVVNPTNPQDAATKAYVDANAASNPSFTALSLGNSWVAGNPAIGTAILPGTLKVIWIYGFANGGSASSNFLGATIPAGRRPSGAVTVFGTNQDTGAAVFVQIDDSGAIYSPVRAEIFVNGFYVAV